MTRNNNKLRAVLLAALMVLWVFAGAVAFGGSAAADHVNTQVDHDESWSSSQTRWQGQQLYFKQGALENDHTDWQVREWDSTASGSAQLGGLVRELSFNENNETAIRTGSLEGEYVVTATNSNGSRVVVETDQNGVATNSDTASSGNVDSAYVEVAVQDLTAEFSSSEVSLDDSAQLQLTSNRNGYQTVVSSDNLTQTQLVDVFSKENATTHGSDSVLINGTQSDDSLTAEFNESNDISEGDSFQFTVTAEDTTASDTASISVSEAVAGDANFDQSQFEQERGDILTVSLSSQQLDRFNVTFGGNNVNYEATFEVEPDADGNVVLHINTYYLGRTGGGALNTTDESVIYDTGAGSVANFSQNEENLTRVLDEELYDLSAEQHNGDTASNEEPTEYDVAVASLSSRETGDMTTYTAPNDRFNQFTSAAEIQDGKDEGYVTESSDIAIQASSRSSATRGDTIVHEVDVSGIEGVFAPGTQSGLDKLNANNQINLTLKETNPEANEDPIELESSDLDSSQARVVTDLENDTLYVVVRPNHIQQQYGANVGDEFDVEFTVTSDYGNQFLRQSNRPAAAETANDSFSLVDRTASFDTRGGEIQLSPNAEAQMTGETSVAPGTELSVRARATGESPFLKTSTATVAEDGTFTATFDFSNIEVGQNFTATIPSQSFEDDTRTDGRVTEGEQASASLSDVTATEGEEVDSITVDSAFLPQGGFVTIHDGSLLDGATFDSVRGTSDYLSEGDHSDVEVSLDDPYTEDGTAIAMPHKDSNGNQEYDFVDSEGSNDGPYTDENGDAVVDDASVTFEGEDTETPTDTETETPEDTETDTPTDGEGSDEQAGFGAVVALIALLGAALLAARRNAF